MTSEVKTLNDQISKLVAKRDRLQRNAQPGVGSVVRFTRYLGRGTYTYAAIRTDIGWYVTGRDGSRKYTWSELLDYADSDNMVTNTGWKSIDGTAALQPSRFNPSYDGFADGPWTG